MIGFLGGIRFRVSEDQVLTFRNLKQEISATWNTTNRIGLKPMMEYGGPDLQTVSLEIILDAGLGVKPRILMNALERMTELGISGYLIIGRRRVGQNKWVITKCSQAYDTVLHGGEVYKGTVSLTLQEYV